MENLGTALGLLLIGMVMVIIVLWLVVSLGNLLIIITNKYTHDEAIYGNSNSGIKIDKRKVAVITAAVDIVTQGQGRVDSIQKKNKIKIYNISNGTRD